MTHLSLHFSYNISWKNKYDKYPVTVYRQYRQKDYAKQFLFHISKSVGNHYIEHTDEVFAYKYIIRIIYPPHLLFFFFDAPNLKPETSNDVI